MVRHQRGVAACRCRPSAMMRRMDRPVNDERGAARTIEDAKTTSNALRDRGIRVVTAPSRMSPSRVAYQMLWILPN